VIQFTLGAQVRVGRFDRPMKDWSLVTQSVERLTCDTNYSGGTRLSPVHILTLSLIWLLKFLSSRIQTCHWQFSNFYASLHN